MVSTRGHPRAFPEPSTGSSTPAASLRGSRSSNGSASSPASPSTALTPRRSASTSSAGWSHTPSNLVLLWLAVSLPLVIWDTGYILLRPHTFPGGSLYWPIYVPYKLYGTIDYVYSIMAYENKNGFTGAQALLNVIETTGYIVYLWLVFTYGKETKAKGRGAPKKNATPNILQKLVLARSIGGPEGGFAALLGFGVSAMTVSKTVLYLLLQYCSDYADIGHNDAFTLIFLYILPNGAWIVVPSYMLYVFGAEILQGLEIASKRRS